MARYRTIKPELFADEKLTECTVDARFTFVGLLPFVDDMGRRQYHPRRIKSEVFPGDDDITANVVDACVQELAKAGVVELYSVDGKRYLRIPHFLRHQVINRPGHCYVPPSPTEGPDAIQCLCTRCKAKNGMFLQEHSEYSLSNHGVVPEYAPQEGKGREGKGVYRASIDPKSSKELHTHSSEAKKADPTPLPEMSEKDRRTQSAAVDEIARRMLNTLELGDNSLLLQVLTKTIEVIIRARSCTVESASQRVWARAALLAAESPPEDWVLWFADARYEYVPQGDKRLQDRRLEARPVCGGERCLEGWEVIRVNGHDTSRRCPECAQLWRDEGYSSE